MAVRKFTRALRARSHRSPTQSSPAAAASSQRLSERLAAERRRLFRAAAIVDVCRYACVSKLEGFDPEELVDALQAAYDLIDDTADALADDAIGGAA